jgi:hypothetical protein
MSDSGCFVQCHAIRSSEYLPSLVRFTLRGMVFDFDSTEGSPCIDVDHRHPFCSYL